MTHITSHVSKILDFNIDNRCQWVNIALLCFLYITAISHKSKQHIWKNTLHLSNDIKYLYSVQHHRHTAQGFEQFGALDMHNHEKAENIDKVKVYTAFKTDQSRYWVYIYACDNLLLNYPGNPQIDFLCDWM